MIRTERATVEEKAAAWDALMADPASLDDAIFNAWGELDRKVKAREQS